MDWREYREFKNALDEVPWPAFERERRLVAWLDDHEEDDVAVLD